MISEKTASFFEITAKKMPSDYACSLYFACIKLLSGDVESAYPVLQRITAERAAYEYADFAAMILCTYNYFGENNKPYIQFSTFEELVEALLTKKIRHEWDNTAVADFFNFLKDFLLIKWVPPLMIDILNFFMITEDYARAFDVIGVINQNYPQSYWDARARSVKIEIEYLILKKKINEFRQLKKVMEFKRGSGAVQTQDDIDRKLSTEHELAVEPQKFEEEVLHLCQRYKNYRFVREQLFRASSIYELLNNERQVIKILSHVNNFLGDFDESIRAHFDLGLYYFKTENFQMALQFFNNHIMHYPESKYIPQSIFMIGKIFQMQGRLSEAINFFKKVISYDDEIWKKEASSSAIEICKELYRQKKYNETLEFLTQIRASGFTAEAIIEATFIEGSCNRDIALITSGNQSYTHAQKAAEIFRLLKQRYPDTTFAALAQASLKEIESGTLKNAVMVEKVSTILIVLFYMIFFGILGYSIVMRNESPVYFMLMIIQIALLISITIFSTGYKIFTKIFEYFFE
ncbi:MAG: hypothetical protein QMC67_05170 [Candidatus Wallbacteria bacterium]